MKLKLVQNYVFKIFIIFCPIKYLCCCGSLGRGTGQWFQVRLSVYLFTGVYYEFGEGNGTPLQYPCLENPMDRGAWWAAVHGVAKSRTRLSDFTFTFYFHALEKEMATHSSVLAWRIPGTVESDGLPPMGSHRVGHDWSDLAAATAAASAAALWIQCLWKVILWVNRTVRNGIYVPWNNPFDLEFFCSAWLPRLRCSSRVNIKDLPCKA